ncbi:uncharacterized protein PFL1_04421 [Pseudozyma flocculosa PF-1]|uniref:Holocytochrome c-type synthase n=2 Tax=Pseudozyma flocculosa TaxID=84751 RepID=A0A5C3FBX3_9BASI|nr:uncharacterized protein PFL1_04421 [Pseudozyma flocculosa PF-1]EPQ28094.1 hypothetical protein PFL1_04421 [Pseudozyma flocculosa PF-1]SPO41892.1 related to CYT2 - holocytochrome-c1 synthase [Pseudozyma flocculosa]
MWPFASSSASSSTQQLEANTDKCPVDHETRLAWLAANPGASHPFAAGASSTSQPSSSSASPAAAAASTSASASATRPTSRADVEDLSRLSAEREVSSIPRHFASPSPTPSTTNLAPTTDNGGETAATAASREGSDEPNWVYPSPLQFYNAMKRKSQNPQVEDMDIVVPIHNAVNEEAWRRIMVWEALRSGSSPDAAAARSTANGTGPNDVKLLNFQGRPRDLTWRAWFRTLAGYAPPFDRHDWTIVRGGNDEERMRYIIDFYGGRSIPSPGPSGDAANGLVKAGGGGGVGGQGVSFFLDVRPAPDSVEGITMRAKRMWRKWALGTDDLGVGPQRRPTTLR